MISGTGTLTVPLTRTTRQVHFAARVPFGPRLERATSHAVAHRPWRYIKASSGLRHAQPSPPGVPGIITGTVRCTLALIGHLTRTRTHALTVPVTLQRIMSTAPVPRRRGGRL